MCPTFRNFLFTLVAWISVTPLVVAQERSLARGHIGDVGILIKLSDAQVEATPAWDPNTQPKPPLEVEEALRLAKAGLSQKYPALKDTRWIVSLELRELRPFVIAPVVEGSFLQLLGSIRIRDTARYGYLIRFRSTGFSSIQESHVLPDGRIDVLIDKNARSEVPVAVLLDRTVIVAEASDGEAESGESNTDPDDQADSCSDDCSTQLSTSIFAGRAPANRRDEP
jgi:hypothetical protein